jgi:flagellar hook-associated protein FlgK
MATPARTCSPGATPPISASTPPWSVTPANSRPAAPGRRATTPSLLALAQLGSQTQAALSGQTFSQSYAGTVSDLGDAISSATDQLNTSQAVSTTLTNQRSSTSGVSIDQEMTNLLQFQKAYEASAKLVSTVDAMMETVINMKTA